MTWKRWIFEPFYSDQLHFKIMASSSSELSSDPTSDLATLISKGTVNEEVLQLYAEKGQVDIPDKYGRTPLMIACLKGLEDTVKFLLANGANPNSKCLKHGNTPMHYACIVDEQQGSPLSSLYYSPSQWITCKIAIIKVLLGSGAQVMQNNLNRWSPPCLAALYQLKDVVEFFLAMDDAEIPLEEKIKATEILGVSQATLDPGLRCRGKFSSFSLAISFRKGANLPKDELETSELSTCFSKISLYECHTEEELELIKDSNVALKAHGYLVGHRLFPKDLTQRYLYTSLASFGCDLMWNGNKFKEGLQVLSFAIRLESQGELKLGTVLSNLAHKFGLFVFSKEEPNHQFLQCVRDLLCEYESVMNHVHIDSLSDHCNSLLENFSEILFNEAFDGTTIDIRSTLQAIEKLVRIIRGRICKENPDKYQELSSVTFKILNHLDWKVDFHKANETLGNVPSRSLLRTKFVICKMLCFESASYKDRDLEATLLHLVAYMYCVLGPCNLELLEDLALAFVRHGCPIDVVNCSGDTARAILEEEEVYDQERCPRLFTLLSPPTTVLTLQETAIRAILHHKLIYQETLPPSLCAIIEGGLQDSDLV